jgi:phosphomannomutase
MLAALHVIAALGGQQKPLSELLSAYSRYAASGEVNSTVDDADGITAEIERTYGARPGANVDHLDGLTVDLGDGRWFNLRPSNTEPLLRLNVEAPDEATMVQLRDEVLSVIRA